MAAQRRSSVGLMHMTRVAASALALAAALCGQAVDGCTANISSISNGFCDAANNSPECGYDGGDCCECTCKAGVSIPSLCGSNGFDCKDPEASCFANEVARVGGEFSMRALSTSALSGDDLYEGSSTPGSTPPAGGGEITLQPSPSSAAATNAPLAARTLQSDQDDSISTGAPTSTPTEEQSGDGDLNSSPSTIILHHSVFLVGTSVGIVMAAALLS